ncbi:MAG: cell wall hydrolase [Lachnospiraceae bacterium]|nr:cell wall hydrolase [Lachnospiraceae bacterium]MDY5522325.1 cell wall hydrolase [Agathobacter sp.]
MKAMKKVIRCATVAALALALTITAVTGNTTGVATEERPETELEKNGIAGVAVVLNEYENEAADVLRENVSVEKEEIDVVAASIEEDAEEATIEVVAEETLTPEEEEWQDKLMADVDDYLCVRAKADKDSEVVGKMYKGDRAVIKKEGKTWTKIESGNVKGYVKNEYCVFGTDALEYAKKNCDTVAKVETDGLRVRSEADVNASVVKAVGKGDKLVVDTKADEVEGWVAVKLNSKTYYVSAEYVTVKLDTGKAITIAEEQAAMKKAAASSSNGQTTTTSTAPGNSLAASADEETLLAALIQCEAGGCGVECMTAVAAVVINRVHSGLYPNTIYGVIYQRGQFGPASSGRLEQRLANGVSSSARQAAQAALAGSDPTGGAKSFKLASSGHAGVVIGPIVFY